MARSYMQAWLLDSAAPSDAVSAVNRQFVYSRPLDVLFLCSGVDLFVSVEEVRHICQPSVPGWVGVTDGIIAMAWASVRNQGRVATGCACACVLYRVESCCSRHI